MKLTSAQKSELLAAVVVLAVVVGMPAAILGYQQSLFQPTGPTEVLVTLSQWKFDPGTITAKKGTVLVLRLVSVDVEHGFAIPALGVDVVVKPGSYLTLRIELDRVGVFTIECFVICGRGHWEMQGALIVTG